jgi:hypothetical protein
LNWWVLGKKAAKKRNQGPPGPIFLCAEFKSAEG